MRTGYWYLLVIAALTAAQGVEGYTGLVGSEFMVYPLDGWTADVSNYTSNNGYISFVAFHDDTSVTFYRMNDDGTETAIYDGVLNKGQARDFNRQETDHFFIHIVSNETGYVYAGSYGALRSPPATNGLFLADEFIIHWPDINDGVGWLGATQYVDVCTWDNANVSVTITPVNASTGEESQFNGLPAGNITFNLTGNGVQNDVVCEHVELGTTGNGSSGAILGSTTAIIHATGGHVHVVQHIDHIDTMNWLGAYDTGTLIGSYYIFGIQYEPGVDVFNPSGENNVTCDLYCNTSTKVNVSDHDFTVGPGSTFKYRAIIPPNSFRFLYNNTVSYNPGVHCKLNCTGHVSAVAGGLADEHNFDSPGAGTSATDKNHLYSRAPPLDYVDMNFELPFYMRYNWRDTGTHSGEVGGASWVWYQTACEAPTAVNFNHSSTVCFNRDDVGVRNIIGGTNAYPLGFQVVNSTILFFNAQAVASQMQVNCGTGNVTDNGDGTYSLTNCQSMYVNDGSNTYNGTINTTNMNMTGSVSGGNILNLTANDDTQDYTFGFFLNGRVQLRWTNAGGSAVSCLHAFIMHESGVIHMSGTDGVQANGAGNNPTWARPTILRFNATQGVQTYRIASAPCSNSPIESNSPYIVTDLSVTDPNLLVGDNTSVSGSVKNVGGKSSVNTIADHYIPRELHPHMHTLRIWFVYKDSTDVVEITNNVTINDSAGCQPTDIHQIFEGGGTPVICKKNVDIPGSPYPDIHFYFNLSTFYGIGGEKYSYVGEALYFNYTAKLMYINPAGVTTTFLDVDYQYCSPYTEEFRNDTSHVPVEITTPDTWIAKSVEPRYGVGETNMTVSIAFGDLNPKIWIANATIGDYYVEEMGLNITYRCDTNATYTRYNRTTGEVIPGYDHLALNVSGVDCTGKTLAEFDTLTFSYINNSFLRNITNNTDNEIVFVLDANDTNLGNITNVGNITYKSLQYNETGHIIALHNMSGNVTFGFAWVEQAGIVKDMVDAQGNYASGMGGNINYTVGDYGLVVLNFTSIQDYKWDKMDIGDDMPDFLEYTGYANLTIRNSTDPNYPNGTWGIGTKNWNWSNNYISKWNITMFMGKKRLKWTLWGVGNISNWTLTFQVKALDMFQGTASEWTLQRSNYGFLHGVYYQQEIHPTSTPVVVIEIYPPLPGMSISKNITGMTRNYPDGPLEPGDYINYSILVNNTGNRTFYNMTVGDEIPENTTFYSWSSKPRVWWNYSWKYRKEIMVTEPWVSNRTNWPVRVFINFDGHKPQNCSEELRIVDRNADAVVPFNITSEGYDNGNCSNATVTFLVNISISKSKIYYVYYGNPSANPLTFGIWNSSCDSNSNATNCSSIYYSRTSIPPGLDIWTNFTSVVSGDDESALHALPFGAFRWFDKTNDSFYVSTNGFLSAQDTTDNTPTTSEFRNNYGGMIAPWWRNWTSDVYRNYLTDEHDVVIIVRRVIFTWTNLTGSGNSLAGISNGSGNDYFYNENGSSETTFQTVLYDTGDIMMRYNNSQGYLYQYFNAIPRGF